MNRSLSTLALTLALGLGAAVLAPGIAIAFDPASTAATNVDSARVALHGHDPVAYFTVAKPTPGDASLAATHEGATYHFASVENLQAFQADPARYAPQYGGFCAFGVAVGGKFDIDPTQFKVVDGRLFLNKNADVAKLWSKDVTGNVAKADQAWPAISAVAPQAL